MDVKLCRICGKLDENYVHIFKIEGLKNKIETCLPIVIHQYSLLPDTICNACRESVDNFYSFIKNCLQNIIVLEAQYEIIDSCLKTKRKKDKSCCVTESDFETLTKNETKTVPQENFVNLLKNSSLNLKPSDNFVLNRKVDSPIPNFQCSLVDYEFSDSNSGFDEFETKTESIQKSESSVNNTQSTSSSDIINEIKQRKYLKRKIDEVLPNLTKNSRSDQIRTDSTESSNRRKNKQPKKVEYYLKPKIEPIAPPLDENFTETIPNEEDLIQKIPSVKNFSPKLLSEENLPHNLLSEAKPQNSSSIGPTKNILPDSSKLSVDNFLPEKILTETSTSNSLVPETFQSCLLCEQQFYGPVVLTAHMYETHGIDLTQVFNQNQSQNQPVTNGTGKKKLPELVKIGDVLPKKQLATLQEENFDDPPILEPEIPPSPPQYTLNTPLKNLTCTECSNGIIYPTFKEFSNHRRSQHQIFHCDLCLKYYGRNSHLWKHVNRVHKGHPSITCRLCSKTSASKYHLAQHFAKMHSAKKTVSTIDEPPILTPEEDLLSKKFDGFDFQSVRQSFLIQDMLEKEKNCSKNEVKSNLANREFNKNEVSKINNQDRTVRKVPLENAPKEIDSSSELYTNIITNYTPPPNEGTYKCPKCFKSFYKKNLLKKHKKNCRPRLQKDLLTRCKTCSRIFKDRQSLTKHLINYHSEYTCEICAQAFQSKCEIVSHIRFSHPNSPELVCHCGQILRSKTDLLKHKLDHKDSHVCQFCGDLLPTKIKLKMHILSLHRKILSLSCGICLKLFETQQILRDHVNAIHYDQLSPLTSCTVCGKNYGSKWKTYDHLNKSHGRIFKACKNCLDVFESEEELQKHFEMTHVNKKNCLFEKRAAKNERKMDLKVETNGDILVKNLDEHSSHSEKNVVQEDLKPTIASEEHLSQNFLIQNYSSQSLKNFDPILKKSISLENSKISLLEKRLLGKKIGSEKIFKKSKKLKIKPNFDEKFDEDPIQNSSKRTVYVNSNDPSLCEICLKTWPAKKHLWQHYIRCHKQVAATVCGICLKTNPSYSSLQVHLRENHPNLLYGCGFGSNFICKICGRYHNASSKLKLHMAIHVGFNENYLSGNNSEKNLLELEKNHKDLSESSKIHFNDVNLTEINYEHMIEEVEYSNSGSEKNSCGSPQNDVDNSDNEIEFVDQKMNKFDYFDRKMELQDQKTSLNKFFDQNRYKNELPSQKTEFSDQNGTKNKLDLNSSYKVILEPKSQKSDILHPKSSKTDILHPDQNKSINEILDQTNSKNDLVDRKRPKSEIFKQNILEKFNSANQKLFPNLTIAQRNFKLGSVGLKNITITKVPNQKCQKISITENPEGSKSSLFYQKNGSETSKTPSVVIGKSQLVEKNLTADRTDEDDDEICSDSEPESENSNQKNTFLSSKTYNKNAGGNQKISGEGSVENQIGNGNIQVLSESETDLESGSEFENDANSEHFDQKSEHFEQNSEHSNQNLEHFDQNSNDSEQISEYLEEEAENSQNGYKKLENFDSETEENGADYKNSKNPKDSDLKVENFEILKYENMDSENLENQDDILDETENFEQKSENFDYNSDEEGNGVILENLEDFERNEIVETFASEMDQEFTEIEYDNEIIYEDNILTLNSKENSIISEESNGQNYSDSEMETEGQEKSLEQEMLKNMLGENVIVTKQNLIIDENSMNGDDQNEIFWSNSPEGGNKELDSAIKSISYNEIDVLTETELETAVDSIL